MNTQSTQQAGPDRSHGHVTPRVDGVKARCGGPRICKVCAIELAALNSAAPLPAAHHSVDANKMVPEAAPALPEQVNALVKDIHDAIAELAGVARYPDLTEAIDRLASLAALPLQAAPSLMPDFIRECAASDELLRLLGLDAIQCRTEGGAINLGKVRSLLSDRVPLQAAQAEVDEAQLARAQEIGAVAWAGVDAQSLRDGSYGAPASIAAEGAEPLANLTRCEFDDECDFCKEPSQGSYARLNHVPEDCTETDFYICGGCVSEAVAEFTKGAAAERSSQREYTVAGWVAGSYGTEIFTHCPPGGRAVYFHEQAAIKAPGAPT